VLNLTQISNSVVSKFIVLNFDADVSGIK